MKYLLHQLKLLITLCLCENLFLKLTFKLDIKYLLEFITIIWKCNNVSSRIKKKT